MSLRRGLQVLVGAIRRRVQKQAQAQVHARQRPDGVPCNAGEQSLHTHGRLAGDVAQSWGQNGVRILHQNHPNLARSASKIWSWRLTSRVRFPQANGSSRAAPPSPVLSLLLGFAGVGFVRHESSQLDSDDANNCDQEFGHIDLETAIQTIQSVFKFQDREHGCEEESGLPQSMEAYSVSERILAKGTEGVVYAAKRKEIAPSVEGDAALPSRQDDSVTREDQLQRGEQANLAVEICDEKECNLAIKMMFNYNVGSSPSSIVAEFHAEQLPLLLDRGKFGTDITSVGAERSARIRGTRHPNIVEMYQAFVDDVRVPSIPQALLRFDMALPRRLNPFGVGADTTLYIVMKRYGESLREYLKRCAPLTERTAMLIVAQLLEAVAYLGNHGIVHRDLKTDNILVNYAEDGQMPQVAVADFGCALSLRGKNLPDTVSDHDRRNPGNCALRAPEVKKAFMQNFICYGDYMKADAWALGAIAYEVCGQDNPFYTLQGLQSDTYDEEGLPQLQTEALGLKVVVQLLLQRDPHKRPSAHVAADMLHLFLWQPAFGGLVRLCHGQSSPERELVAWLIKVSLMCCMQEYPSRIDTSAAPGLPQSQAERGLLGLFLGRVNADSLKRATHCAVSALRGVILTVGKDAAGCVGGCLECATSLGSSHVHPAVISLA